MKRFLQLVCAAGLAASFIGVDYAVATTCQVPMLPLKDLGITRSDLINKCIKWVDDNNAAMNFGSLGARDRYFRYQGKSNYYVYFDYDSATQNTNITDITTTRK